MSDRGDTPGSVNYGTDSGVGVAHDARDRLNQTRETRLGVTQLFAAVVKR